MHTLPLTQNNGVAHGSSLKALSLAWNCVRRLTPSGFILFYILKPLQNDFHTIPCVLLAVLASCSRLDTPEFL